MWVQVKVFFQEQKEFFCEISLIAEQIILAQAIELCTKP